MKRPTLAECLGVSTRWQALAVLYGIFACRLETEYLAARIGSPLRYILVYQGEAAELSLRSEVRYLLWLVRTGCPAASVSAPVAAFYRMLAWELLAELRERQARARQLKEAQ